MSRRTVEELAAYYAENAPPGPKRTGKASGRTDLQVSAALARHGGNVKRAASELGMSPSGLWKRRQTMLGRR